MSAINTKQSLFCSFQNHYYGHYIEPRQYRLLCSQQKSLQHKYRNFALIIYWIFFGL